MEVKNIHNNPEERKFFGKVLGYIISGLRSMARPKKNTKWDYLVPLSLIWILFLIWNFTSAEVYDPSEGVYEIVEKSLWEKKGVLFFELIVSLFIISVTIFLTRMQRILVLPGSLLIFLIAEYFYNPKISIFNTVMATLFLVFILSIPYFLSALSLLIKFGNNSKEKISRKPTPIRSAIAWGVYGLGLDFVFLSFMPFAFLGGQAGIQYKYPSLLYRTFDPLYPIMQKLFIINPILAITFFFSFFPFIFALIGYSIEKYKQRRLKSDEP